MRRWHRRFGLLTAALLLACAVAAQAAHLSHQKPLKKNIVEKESLMSLSLDGDAWIVASSNGSVVVPATVPGNIYTDLVAAGVIGDPYYRFGDADYRWVAYDNWSYSTHFNLPAGFAGAGRLVLLECDGLDTVVSLSLNGHTIGDANNMFRKYQFDLTPYLAGQNGSNSLVLQFTSAVSYSKQQAQNYPYELPNSDSPAQHGEPFRNLIRKEQSSFSWDWGPCFITQGIWKSIRIVSYNSARLESAGISVAKEQKPNSKRWIVTANIEISALSLTSATFSLTLDGTNIASNSLQVLPGMSTVSLSGVVENPKIWWPRGYGSQPLYGLIVSMGVGSSVQSQEYNIGFREVKIVENPVPGQQGATFGLQVNGVPIFTKGANFIPIDAFESRVTTADLEMILGSAAEANMNLVRVWGGGIYQSDEFYSIADRMGLMIWEEFMFACAMMPRDQAFLDNVVDEVRFQVRRLMHHPSIVVWSGNNENEAALEWFAVTRNNRDRYVVDQVKLYVDTIREALMQEDQTRSFVFSSPSNGALVEDPYVLRWGEPQSPLWGDVHYYNYLADCTDLSLVPAARFMSEYGFQSFDSIYTLVPTVDPAAGDLAFNSALMNWRQHHDNGTNQIIYQAQIHFRYTPRDSSVDDFKRFIYISQTMQTHCIKTWTEYLRRGRDMPQRTMGAIYWQLNQIWPAPSWSSMEYGGRWKMLHYHAMHFYSDVLVSSQESSKGNLSVFITSDLQKTFVGSLRIDVIPWKSAGQPPNPSVVISVKISPLSASIQYIDISKLLGRQDRKSAFIVFKVTSLDGSEVSRNAFYPSKLKDVNIQQPQIVTSNFAQIGNNTISFDIVAAEAAPYTWIESPFSGRFSDNGLLLLPGETRKITFKGRGPTSINLASFQSSLSVISLFDPNP